MDTINQQLKIRMKVDKLIKKFMINQLKTHRKAKLIKKS